MSSAESALSSEDVVQGRILWLPEPHEIYGESGASNWVADDAKARQDAIPMEVYGHPVLVISRPAIEPHVTQFLVLTSNRGRTLQQKFPAKYDCRRAGYLPIWPTKAYPDNSEVTPFPTLFLVNGAKMPRVCYAEVDRLYSVDWSLLRIVKQDGLEADQLAQDSLGTLLGRFQLEPQVGELRTTSKMRGRKPSKAIVIVNPATRVQTRISSHGSLIPRRVAGSDQATAQTPRPKTESDQQRVEEERRCKTSV